MELGLENQYLAGEIDRYFDTDMNMFVIDPKGQIAYQQLQLQETLEEERKI